MHKSATKCNETIGKWCKNKLGASKIIDTFETYQLSLRKSFQIPLVHGQLVFYHVAYKLFIIFILAIAFNYLISCQELYLFVFPYLPWLLWIHLFFLKLFGVLINRGSGDDSIFEHFVFKCKILNNALILGELSYICYNILLLLFFNWYWLLLEDKSFLVLIVPS
jgi:hypothetical protein